MMIIMEVAVLPIPRFSCPRPLRSWLRYAAAVGGMVQREVGREKEGGRVK